MAIFSVIGAALTSFVGGIFGAGAFSTFVVKTIARVATSFLLKLLTKRDQPDQAFGLSGKLQTGEETPRAAPFGIGFTEGSLVYSSYWGTAEVPNAYLTQVIALSDLPVKGLVSVIVDGAYCNPFDPSDPSSQVPKDWTQLLLNNFSRFPAPGSAGSGALPLGVPLAEYRVGGTPYAWVRFYDGTQTAADPLLVNHASHPDFPWSATAIGTGVAYAVCTTRLNQELFSGFPRFGFVLDSARLYDPSQDSTVGGDGPQRWANPATWGGSGDYLPVVQSYNIMRGIRYGGEWVYGFQGVSAARLPVGDWIREINKCRAVTPTPNGPRPMFRSGGLMNFAAECGQAIEAIMASAAGRIAEIGGIYKPFVGAPNAPVMHIDEDDIVSSEGHSFMPMKRLAERINAVEATYPEPQEGFSLKAAPPLYSAEYEAVDGGRRLPSQITLYNVPYSDQVTRLQSMAVAEARKERRHVFVLPPRFYRLEPLDTVTFTSAPRGYENKQFRVDTVSLRTDCHVMVEITEVDPEDYDFEAFAGYTGPIITETRLPTLGLSSFMSLLVSPLVISDASGLPRRTGIRVSWDADSAVPFSGVAVEVQENRPGAIPRVVRQLGVEPPFDIMDGLHGSDYLVRVRPITRTPSEFSSFYPVTVPSASIQREELSASIQNALDQAVLAADLVDDLADDLSRAGLSGIVQTHEETLARVADAAFVRQEYHALVIEEQLARANLRTELSASIAENQSQIVNESVARSTQTAALAAQIDTVSASVGDLSAEVTTQATAIATVEGNLASSLVLRTRAGGASGEVEVVAADGPSGPASVVSIRSDRFQFVGDLAEFLGDVRISGALIVDGWVTKGYDVEFSGVVSASGGTTQTVGSVTTEAQSGATTIKLGFTVQRSGTDGASFDWDLQSVSTIYAGSVRTFATGTCTVPAGLISGFLLTESAMAFEHRDMPIGSQVRLRIRNLTNAANITGRLIVEQRLLPI